MQMDRWTGVGGDGGTHQGKGREEAGRGQPNTGRAPQQMRLLGCGREQQRRKGGMVGGRSRELSSGEQRQEENGMGTGQGRVPSWPMQKVRLHDCEVSSSEGVGW